MRNRVVFDCSPLPSAVVLSKNQVIHLNNSANEKASQKMYKFAVNDTGGQYSRKDAVYLMW